MSQSTMTSKAETFSIRLPELTRAKVDQLAALTKRSRSFIINEAVEAYVTDRAGYILELDSAVLSAQSGIGHSGPQIFSWMQTWGKSDELPSPVPDLAPPK